MSDLTKDNLDAAIAAHFQDAWNEATIVTGYVLQVSGMTSTDMDNGAQHSYHRETADGQPAHVTMGLIDYAHTSFRAQFTLRDEDDDD